MSMLTPEQQKTRTERTLQKRTIWESREVMYTAYRDRRAFKSWTDEVFADYIEGATRPLDDGRVKLKCDPVIEETFYQSRRDLDTSKVLQGLGGKYVLLVGDYDGALREYLKLVYNHQGSANWIATAHMGRARSFEAQERQAEAIAELEKIRAKFGATSAFGLQAGNMIDRLRLDRGARD